MGLSGDSIYISELSEGDCDQWFDLFNAYLVYYKLPTVSDNPQTWKWLMEGSHVVKGLKACYKNETGEEIMVGFTHYRQMPSPARGTYIGFIDDLFVDPQARGLKVADKLMQQVQCVAREQGWKVVRWITKDDNYRARGVYDRIGYKTDWVTYEMDQGTTDH
eukprot:Nk52_evm77s1737 gene=Nk52_evmTU77s1737